MNHDLAQNAIERFLRERIREDLRIIEVTVDDLASSDESRPGDELVELYLGRFAPGRLRAEARARDELLRIHQAHPAGEAPTCGCPRTATDVCRSLAVTAWGYLGHAAYDLAWEHS